MENNSTKIDALENDNTRWKSYQLITLLLILLLFFVDGIDIQIMSLILPSLADDWGLQASDFSLAMAIGFAGSAVGASLGGMLGDFIGRKPAIIGSLLLLGVMTVSMAYAKDIKTLVVIRFFAGIGMGACVPAAMALLSETVPKKHRSIAVSLALVSTPLGISMAGLITANTIPDFGWQTPLLICGALPLLLGIIFLVFLPALSLTQQSKQDSADQNNNKIPFKMLLQPQFRWSLIGLIGCFFMTYCAMSTALIWLPTLFSGEGFSVKIASLVPSIWSTAGIVGTLLAGWFMGRFGSRYITNIFILIGITGCVALIFLSPSSNDKSYSLPIIYSMLTVAGFSLSGIVSALYTRTTEAFPSSIRSTSIGICITAGRIGGIFGAFAGVYSIEWGGFSGFFTLISFFLICALLLFQIERKGKNLPIQTN